MLRRLLVVVVILQFTPMLSELAEWSGHYLRHGDFAHRAGHARNDEPDEHGCTPVFHACGCHAGTSATPAASSFADAAPAPRGFATSHLTSSRTRNIDSPPHRPPIV